MRRLTLWVPVATVVALGLWLSYRAVDREIELNGGFEASRLLLQVLTLALVVLTLGLAGVLIRNLVRLIVDRKRGILGSRLRTKLVFFFLALVLLPAITLFIGSVKLIQDSGEAILLSRSPVESLIQQSREIVDRWSESFQDRCLGQAEAVAGEIARAGLLDARRREQLERLLETHRKEAGLGLFWVVSGDRVLASSESPEGGPPPELRRQLEQRVVERTRQAASRGRPMKTIERLGEEGLVAHAAVPVPGQPTVTVTAGIVLPSRIAAAWREIDAANQNYRQFRLDRRESVRLYLTLIGLIFVATLFVATWIGFYISRRMTVPIQELAAASREISTGNLDVRVRTHVGDELGTLVDTFNEMAAELQESREVITRSTGELRRSNRALEERRHYIETLVANLSTAVISLDPIGRVTTANPAVRRILAVELGPGDDVRAVFRKRGLDPLADLVDQALQRRESVRGDLELPGRAETLNISVQVSPLVGGSVDELGHLLMVEDLTDLLRAQKALAWQEVARRIAHEIKNPLTPIQLAAQRLRKKFAEGAPDLGQVLQEATASIEREVGGLKRLVDEFSRFARMPELSPKPVELSKVVESALALYRGLPGVHWDVELDAGIDRVNVDAEQMRRAMINLIDNALAAMEGQGTIRVTTRSRPREGLLRIEVADSGPGIPHGDRDKMFAPYFSTKRKGTGLGLAIVHKVVTDHRGTIRVEDNPPHGACFVIEIPA